MNDAEVEGYFAVHERLAVLAVEATDRSGDPDVPDVVAEIVAKAPDTALLLSLAIAYAEDRALRGEAPGPPTDVTAASVRPEGVRHGL